MPFPKKQLPRCPKCRSFSIEIIETRHTAVSTRRRKKCQQCGYKSTTHEVSESFFNEAKTNQILVNRVTEALNIKGQSGVKVLRCEDCCYRNNNACTLDIPEFNTRDAHDCSFYKQDNPS